MADPNDLAAYLAEQNKTKQKQQTAAGAAGTPDAMAPAPAPESAVSSTPLPPSPAPAPAPAVQPPGFVASKAGGWVPPDHPDAVTATPAAAATPPAATPTPSLPVGTPEASGQLPAATGTATAPPPPSPIATEYGGRQTAPVEPRPATVNPVEHALQDAIMQQLGQTTTPTADDPLIKSQMAGVEATAERARRQRQAAAAERLAGQGLSSSGAADAELASGYQDMGQMVADQQRQMLQAETVDRRNRLQQTLATGSQFLSAEKQADLQKELGYLNAQMQREGFGTQKEIAGAQLATDQWKTQVGADLQRAGYASSEAIAQLDNASQERIANLDAQMKAAGYASNERIAAIDAAVRQAQTASQTGLGMADINLRGMLGRGQLNLGLLQTLLGDAQARDRLGFDAGSFMQNQNYLATLAMLGGGGA